MKRTLILIVGLVLFVAACGGDESAGSPTTTTPADGESVTTTTVDDDIMVPPEDPGALVLQVHFEGGFVPVEMAYHPAPVYSLLADGRLLAPGMIPLIYPGPLMNPVQIMQLDDATVAQIMELVEAMGLPDITEERIEDTVNIADAGDTVVTFFDENGAHRFAVYALGGNESDDPRAQAMSQLMATLESAGANGEPIGEYEPEAVEVLISPSLEAEKEPGAEVVDWPLPVGVAEASDIGGATGIRCLALDGEDAAYALEVFSTATQATFFEEGGEVWRLTPRPLFPQETGCPTP